MGGEGLDRKETALAVKGGTQKIKIFRDYCGKRNKIVIFILERFV